jgi:uncharacterized protein YkwD
MMSKIRAVVLSVSLLLALIAPVVLPVATASAVSGSALYSLVNARRSTAGLSAYRWNDSLSSSAYAKAKDMCKKHYWAHTSPDGLTPWTFIKASGYSYVNAGENLAADFSTDTGVVKGWMNSPAHRANLLHGKFKEIGIASMKCNLTGKSTTVVVAHFGARIGQPAASRKPSPVQKKSRDAVVTKSKVSQASAASKKTVTKQKAATSDQKVSKPSKPAPATLKALLVVMLAGQWRYSGIF